MTQRIQEDRKFYHDIIRGRAMQELKHLIHSGQILRRRGKNGVISYRVPEIRLPFFIFADNPSGIGMGPGKEGTIIGKVPGKGKGRGDGDKSGNGAGDGGGGGGIEIDVDMKEVWKHIQADLKLPNLKPKDADTWEEFRIKYTSTSKVGAAALLHRRKTLLKTIRRVSASGQFNNLIVPPGYSCAIRPLAPIRDDMVYRQWREHKIRSHRAMIFFLRDVSGSMDDEKCDIVNDLSWWIDSYIQTFYERTDRCYVVHDTAAREVSEKKFYSLRQGGGTICSTALEYVAQQIKTRFPPSKFNIYVFYFGDGDNWGNDNEKFIKIAQDELGPKNVNLLGLTEILPSSWGGYNNTLKSAFDQAIANGTLSNKFARSVSITNNDPSEYKDMGWNFHMDKQMTEESRNAAILKALRELLGSHKQDQLNQPMKAGA